MTLRHVLLLALLCVVSSLACQRSRPNILLVTFDTTRADHVGYAAGRKDVTPTLDALAANGTWFTTAVTSEPLTVPAHTTIMTGLYPYRHGVRNNGTYIVPAENVTIAERLRQIGYATHATVSAFVLDSQFGLDQGFDGYDDDLTAGPKQKMFMFKEVPASVTADKAVRWLKEARPKDKPFFLWTHFFDPHADYHPPDDLAARFPDSAYQGEISYADRELGRVIAALRELKIDQNTIVIFTSDHGESLGEHGEMTHGIFVYDGTARVPLLLSGPGIPKKKVEALVRTADIYPTVLDLLGLDQENVDGRSLRPLWTGKAKDDRVAYVESFSPRLNFGWAELRSLRTKNAKVIDAPRPELYDLAGDPKESQNVYRGGDIQLPGARPLAAELKRLISTDPFNQGKQQQSAMDAESRQKLAALGYVFGTDAHQSGPRPDPKDRIGYWTRFEAAQAMIRNRQYEPALASLKALLAEDPNNVVAMGSLANALQKTHQPEEALSVYKRMIALDPNRETPYLGAAKILRDAKNYAESEALARQVIQIQPQNPEGYTALGDIHLETENYAEAEKWFLKARQIDPNSSLAITGLGNCLNRAGRLKEALALLRAGYEKDKNSQALVYNLAVVTERSGDTKTALKLYQESLKLEPDHSMTWNNIGSLLDRAGNRAQAVRCIRKAHELDPENVEATYNLGALLLAQKRPDLAIPLFVEALQNHPDFLPAATQLARAFTQTKQYDKALEIWNRLAPRHPGAWLQIARIELARGNPSAAKKALARGRSQGGQRFEAALERNPELKKLAG